MKTYSNGMKATEFTTKQIGVIYHLAKQGKLSVEKWYMPHLYDMAKFYNCDFNKSAELEENCILSIIDSVLLNDLESAQENIDNETEKLYNQLSIKKQNKCNRCFV